MNTHFDDIAAELARELRTALAGDGAAAATIGDRVALRKPRDLRRELETRARAGWEDAARVLAASRPGPAMCEDARVKSPPPLQGGDPRTAGVPHA